MYGLFGAAYNIFPSPLREKLLLIVSISNESRSGHHAWVNNCADICIMSLRCGENALAKVSFVTKPASQAAAKMDSPSIFNHRFFNWILLCVRRGQWDSSAVARPSAAACFALSASIDSRPLVSQPVKAKLCALCALIVNSDSVSVGAREPKFCTLTFTSLA